MHLQWVLNVKSNRSARTKFTILPIDQQVEQLWFCKLQPQGRSYKGFFGVNKVTHEVCNISKQRQTLCKQATKELGFNKIVSNFSSLASSLACLVVEEQQWMCDGMHDSMRDSIIAHFTWLEYNNNQVLSYD